MFTFTAFIRHKDRAFAISIIVTADNLKAAFDKAKGWFGSNYEYFKIISYERIGD